MPTTKPAPMIMTACQRIVAQLRGREPDGADDRELAPVGVDRQRDRKCECDYECEAQQSRERIGPVRMLSALTISGGRTGSV